MAQSKFYEINWHLQLIYIIYIIFSQYGVSGQRQEVVAPVAPPPPPHHHPSPQTKILIPNLPANHYRFWLRNHPKAFREFERICSQVFNPLDLTDLKYFQSLHANLSLEDSRYLIDFAYGKIVLDEICSKINNVTKSCWGYENNCQLIYLMPECEDSKGKSEQEKKIEWFSQADFGYVLDRRREMNRYCSPPKTNDTGLSSFECTKNFKTCRGQNLYINFVNVPKEGGLNESKQYLLSKGNVGGWGCDLQAKRIREEDGQEGFLKSWFNELQYYNIITQPREICDITIEKQAFFIKLDSTSNMYHYFCNFINLYATIHLNQKFSEDNEIIIWDNHTPKSKFNKMWSAFSRNRLRHIGEFDGKKVCFKNFIFTLLPRMDKGLYYRTPLVQGCSKTGLFDAFNKHVLHRLNISNDYKPISIDGKENKSIRVTIVQRSSIYRKIINEGELADFALTTSLENKPINFEAKLIDFKAMSFQEQVRIIQDTDILVGIHGAELTNLLFLPDWAAIIELYDCGDTRYRDLAKLRGVSYHTPQDKDKFIKKLPIEDEKEIPNLIKSKLFNHDEYSNYQINVSEFRLLLEKVAQGVKENRFKHSQSSKINMDHEQGAKIEPDIGKDSAVDVNNLPHDEL